VNITQAMAILVTLKWFKSELKRFAENESGATAIEYGILISILSLAIIGSANSVWVVIKDKFVYIGNVITAG
jgi:pilus assembly protein Flp/PilA